MILAQDPAFASPTALSAGQTEHHPRAFGPSPHAWIPITLKTPWVYRATFFHGVQSTFPPVISPAWGSGVWEGRAFLSPFYRSNPRPGERWVSPSMRADPEKSSPVHSSNPLRDG